MNAPSPLLPVGALLLVAAPVAHARQDAAAAPDAPAAAATPDLFRLHSGDILWGSLRGHTPEGVEVVRLDTGGLARMPWTFLDPAQAEELRLRFGYQEAEGEELMVAAERIRLASGGEIVGIVDGRTEEHLYLRTSSARLPIPLADIVGTSTRVQVPALDVYTKEELYQAKAQELAGALAQEGEAGAAAQLELAEYAERLLDYRHAVDAYRRAAELAPAFRSDFVAAGLERAEAKAAVQEQVDMLAAIDRLRARRQFKDALEALAQFPERYPDSPLMTDWNRLRERVADHQERVLREEVVRQWHYAAVQLTREIVREAESYDEVLAALDGEVTRRLEERLVASLDEIAPGIEVEEVRRLWEAREKVRTRSASYGIGTWLLGEERALEVPSDEDEAEERRPASGSRDEARAELEERLRRYMRNQAVQRRAQGGQSEDGLEEPNEFWKRWALSARSMWALAYYAEFSGEFEVVRVDLRNCRECGGTGAKEILFTGSAIAGDNSGTRLYRCSVCHGIGRVRRVKYE